MRTRDLLVLLSLPPLVACVATGSDSTEGDTALLSASLCEPDERGGYGVIQAGAQRADEDPPVEAERRLFDGLVAAGAMDGEFDPARIHLDHGALVLASADRDIGAFRTAVIELDHNQPVGIESIEVDAFDWDTMNFQRFGTCLATFGSFCRPDVQAAVTKHVRAWFDARRMAAPQDAKLSALFDELVSIGALGGRFDPNRFGTGLAIDTYQLRITDGFSSGTELQYADLTFRILGSDRLALVRTEQRFVPWRESVQEDGTVVWGGPSVCEPEEAAQ